MTAEGETQSEPSSAAAAPSDAAGASERPAPESADQHPELEALSPRQLGVLVVAVFAAGLCSIVYELLIATASSYFLGDSIRQFSITIGLFMAAMGLGSFLSRTLGERVLGTFIAVEIALGAVGGVCIPALYGIYAYTELYQAAMVAFIVVIGTLTGLEIPILVLAMRRYFALRANLSNILSLDYLGALAATLLFPFVLLPLLGTFKSSLVVGAVNVAVALVVMRAFKQQLQPARRVTMGLVAGSTLCGLALVLIFSQELLRPWHLAIYEDRVLLVRQSSYQKIVLTQNRDDLRLYLNGNLQFSSIDEYRYHEALVHPAMSIAPRRDRVLILGGGDGLVAREVLEHDDAREITVVDLDPAITSLAAEHHLLRELNRDSLHDERVTVKNDDAWRFARNAKGRWDVIIIDLPDPNDTGLAKLYSREFYGLLRRRLAEDGVLVTQATSPFFAREAFWCIASTIEAAGYQVRPYHSDVPSFGDWGFVMAARYPLKIEDIRLRVPTTYLDDGILGTLFEFPKDVRVADARFSTLDEPLVLRHYLAGWKYWK